MSIPPTPFTPELWVAQSDDFLTNSGAFLSGSQAVLVDPGVRATEIDAIAAFVREQHADVRRLVLTHSHWDHVLGPERFPWVPVIAQARFPEVAAQQAEAIVASIGKWEARLGQGRGQPFRVPVPDETFEDDGLLLLGTLSLRLLHVPGHAPDQLALYQAERGLLWASDLLSDVEIPLVADSLAAYEHTLARLAGLELRALVPGHGHPATGQAEIQARLAEDRAYLAELRARVQACVTRGVPLPETLARCAAMSYRNPAENRGSHQLNVESAYLELGGDADRSQVGWQ
jgi:glyoxylase-like metal-dependent hydrolase (beta-lactamase superfamily II)